MGELDYAEPLGLTPASARPRLLLVDDDAAILALAGDGLAGEGFSVERAESGEECLRKFAAATFDLVVLDINLPTCSGLDVLRELRRLSRVPVIVLSGRGDEIDRVLGLEIGADDYVPKPFSIRELAARARAVLRRAVNEPAPVGDYGDLVVDFGRRLVALRGERVDLRAKEFDLLAFLARFPGTTYSREQLLAQVWNSAPAFQDLATVTEHVRRLRRKIEDDPERPRWIRTRRGYGYSFEP